MEDKRKLILKIGEEIISKKGYSATTVEEITKKAGIGKGTFYIYFKNKEELFYSIIKEGLDKLIIEIRNSTEKIDSFFEKLKKGIEMYLAYYQKNYFLFKIFMQEKPLKTKDFSNFWKDFFDRWDFIKKGLNEQIEKGIIKKIEVDDIIYSLLGLLHGNIHRWIVEGRNYSLVEKKDVIFEIFVNGIRRKE